MARILVIDDGMFCRELLAEVLRQKGHLVETAADGQQALAVVAVRKPELIILDITIPFGGVAFLQELRKPLANRHLPVVVLTSCVDRLQIQQAVRYGLKEYMLKSAFSVDDLLQRLARHLPQEAGDNRQHAPPASASASPMAAVKQGSTAPASSAASSIRGVERPHSHPIGRSLREELAERVRGSAELRGFSPALQNLMASDPERDSLQTVTKIVKQDPALVMRLLSLANSSLYSRGGRVDTVHRAIQRIGLRQLRQTAMSLQVIDGFREPLAGGRLDAGAFWEHSIACGLLAFQLSTLLKLPPEECESAFSAGLLHDCGRMVLAQILDEQYGQVLDRAAETGVPVEHAESSAFGMNHADVAKIVLTAWRLPETLVVPISLHHDLPATIADSPASVRPAQVLALANRMAKALALGDSGNSTLYALKPFLKALDLDASVAASMVDGIVDRTAELKALLLSRSNERPVESSVRGALPSVAVLPLDQPGSLDEVGILLRRLNLTDERSRQGVCVINLAARTMDERAVRQLAHYDGSAGAPVPIIAISSDDNVPACIRSRPNLSRLTMPLRVDALLAALEQANFSGLRAAA